MKLLMLLCLFVTLSCAKSHELNSISDVLEEAQGVLKEAKNQLVSLVPRIQAIKYKTTSILDKQIEEIQIRDINTIGKSINMHLSELYRILEEAKPAGNDALECIKSTSTHIISLAKEEFNDIQNCQETVLQKWFGFATKYDEIVKAAQDLFNEDIIEKCINEDRVQRMECMFDELLKALYYLDTKAKYIDKAAEDNMLTILAEQEECNAESVANVHIVISDATSQMELCYDLPNHNYL